MRSSELGMHVHRRLRASRGAYAFVAGVFFVAVGAATTPTWAEMTAEDIASDSELTLLERNDYGSYRRFSVELTIQDGAATVSIDKDGNEVTVAVPLDECQAMWQTLLESGLESLTDTPAEALPDQSEFIVEFRVKGQEGGFWAYGVDNLTDPSHRNVVQAILDLGNSHLGDRDEGEEL